MTSETHGSHWTMPPTSNDLAGFMKESSFYDENGFCSGYIFRSWRNPNQWVWKLYSKPEFLMYKGQDPVFAGGRVTSREEAAQIVETRIRP